MEQAEIIQKINSFPRWHYQFNLKGNLTPIFDNGHMNRHAQRKRYFFDPLVKHLGGSLAGKRVLDLGCNAGFWSLCALEEGCEFVVGIDGRQTHIDQANFVFEVSDVEKNRYHFVCGNIFEIDFCEFGTFDIVLCLGLMYHISKPMILMEKIAQVNSDILIIDTTLSRLPGSFLQIERDRLYEPRHAMDYELVFYPTKQAVFDIVQQFGYSVVMLKPRFRDYTGALDYQLGLRRAFLCAKQTDLSSLPVEVELNNFFTQLVDSFLFLAHFIKKRLFRRASLNREAQASLLD